MEFARSFQDETPVRLSRRGSCEMEGGKMSGTVQRRQEVGAHKMKERSHDVFEQVVGNQREK